MPRGRCIPLLILLALPVGPADATMMVRRMTFEEVTRESVRIVHGRVAATTAGRDASGAPATWTTIAVTESLKGKLGEELTIKQFGVVEPLGDGAVTRLPGLPRFAVGEEVVLFLRGDSARGFTSPVGFEQGVYRVQQGLARRGFAKDAEPVDQVIAKIKRLSGWAR